VWLPVRPSEYPQRAFQRRAAGHGGEGHAALERPTAQAAQRYPAVGCGTIDRLAAFAVYRPRKIDYQCWRCC
jgi:choline dehydrogenase-like flavoprotein